MRDPERSGLASTSTSPGMKHEVRDLLAFIRRPRFGPRPNGRQARDGYWQDWFPAISIKRLVQWAFLLWCVNLLFLGPIAMVAAGFGGASHRLNLAHIPWLTALLWAPLVEELVFRHGLRRFKHLWLHLPPAVLALINGPGMTGGLWLCVFLLLAWIPYSMGVAASRHPMSWRTRRMFRSSFPWIFHFSSVAFSAVHLYNFNLAQTPLWLLPLLVLPQWVTGLVLGWLRVRRGVGAAIVLHAIFNGGPLLLVFLMLQYAPHLL